MDASCCSSYDQPHMGLGHPRKSRGKADRLRSRGRHLVAALLLLACLPSLLFNVGSGRSVLIHDHSGDAFHTHVVAASFDHAHPHTHGYEQGGDSGELPGSDGPPDRGPEGEPVDRRSDGAKIRGTEVAVSKKCASFLEDYLLHPGVASLTIQTAPPPTVPLAAAFPGDSPRALGRTELTSLRAVVLLI